MSNFYRLIQGDNLKVLPTLKDESIDLIITSPPYDNLRIYGGFSFNFKIIAKELFRIIKKGGVMVWIIGDAVINGSETGTSFKQALYFMEIGFKLHDTMIFMKDSFAFPSSNRYHQTFEYMFVLVKGKLEVFNPIMDKDNVEKGKRKRRHGRTGINESQEWYNDFMVVPTKGKRYNVWKYGIGYMKVTTDKTAYNHPAIFPEKLVNDHIISWSNKNDLILDPFIGSGTTMKITQNLKRSCIGIEIEPRYCEIIKKRCFGRTFLDHEVTYSFEVFDK